MIDFSFPMNDFKTEGENMIKSLLMDESNSGYPDRQTMFNKRWTHAGVACGCHSYYGDMCCVMMG